MAAELILYGRSSCHLCDKMAAAIESFRASYRFSLEVVDVDSHPDLEREFGQKIPVLFTGEEEVCRYFLDSERLTAVLGRVREA